MKSISFLLCLLLTQTLLQGQMNFWTLPPNKVVVNVASPTSGIFDMSGRNVGNEIFSAKNSGKMPLNGMEITFQQGFIPIFYK